MKWAVDVLKYYLWGNTFQLMTDHAPLWWLNTMKDTNHRIMRWYLSLQPYSSEILHREGEKSQINDFFLGVAGGRTTGLHLTLNLRERVCDGV